jgi:hypothetical protein
MRAYFITLVLGASLAAAPFAQAKDEHTKHHHAASGLRLNQGKKWETDEPLRKGMTAIQDALHKLTPATYAETSGSISDSVGEIFKTCKLAPEADAVLHEVLAKILRGASEMKAGAAAKRQHGAEEVRKALAEYAHYFQHPGWAPAASR